LRAGFALAALAAACDSEIAYFGPGTTPTLPPGTPVEPDLDGDGYTASEGDCDDSDPGVGPGSVEFPEYCDGVDNDCGGEVDVIDIAGINTCLREAQFEQSLMVDVLFVVDTTAPMSLYLANLATGARSVLTALAGEAYLDSHIGVVTMDAERDDAGALLMFDGESFISGSDVGSAPQMSHTMAWADTFVSTTFTMNPVSTAPEEGRASASLALGLGIDSGFEGLNPGFLRDGAHLVIVFLTSNEDQTVDPTVVDFEAQLALAKGSLSELTMHAIVQVGELDCYAQSKPEQKGYTYQKLAQDTAGTVLSICTDMTSGFFEAMGQNSAYEGLETEFPLGLHARANTVAVTIVDTMGNLAPLDDYALADDNTTLVITADPPPPAGSLILVEYEMDPNAD